MPHGINRLDIENECYAKEKASCVPLFVIAEILTETCILIIDEIEDTSIIMRLSELFNQK
jgi:hypothetical protein